MNNSARPLTGSVDEQLMSYLNSPLEDGNPLAYWASNTTYPTLAAVAKVVYSVPASSAPVERVFNHCGLFFTCKRTKLTSDKLEKLIFMNCNAEYVL